MTDFSSYLNILSDKYGRKSLYASYTLFSNENLVILNLISFSLEYSQTSTKIMSRHIQIAKKKESLNERYISAWNVWRIKQQHKKIKCETQIMENSYDKCLFMQNNHINPIYARSLCLGYPVKFGSSLSEIVVSETVSRVQYPLCISQYLYSDSSYFNILPLSLVTDFKYLLK